MPLAAPDLPRFLRLPRTRGGRVALSLLVVYLAWGSAYLAVHVAPHPEFRRDRDDLHTIVDVGVHEAALGARIVIAGPDGAVTEAS